MKASITKHEKLGVTRANFGYMPIFKCKKLTGMKIHSVFCLVSSVLLSLILK